MRLRRYLEDGVDPRTVAEGKHQSEHSRKTIAAYGRQHKELAEILDLVDRSTISMRNKLFLKQCLSVVASLEISRGPHSRSI